MKPICIYNPFDITSIGACWVVNEKFGPEVEFIPGAQNTSPLDRTSGRTVILAGMTYKIDTLQRIADRAVSLKDDAGSQLWPAMTVVATRDPYSGTLQFLKGNPDQARGMLVVFDEKGSTASLMHGLMFPGDQEPEVLRRMASADEFFRGWMRELEDIVGGDVPQI